MFGTRRPTGRGGRVSPPPPPPGSPPLPGPWVPAGGCEDPLTGAPAGASMGGLRGGGTARKPFRCIRSCASVQDVAICLYRSVYTHRYAFLYRYYTLGVTLFGGGGGAGGCFPFSWLFLFLIIKARPAKRLGLGTGSRCHLLARCWGWGQRCRHRPCVHETLGGGGGANKWGQTRPNSRLSLQLWARSGRHGVIWEEKGGPDPRWLPPSAGAPPAPSPLARRFGPR